MKSTFFYFIGSATLMLCANASLATDLPSGYATPGSSEDTGYETTYLLDYMHTNLVNPSQAFNLPAARNNPPSPRSLAEGCLYLNYLRTPSNTDQPSLQSSTEIAAKSQGTVIVKVKVYPKGSNGNTPIRISVTSPALLAPQEESYIWTARRNSLYEDDRCHVVAYNGLTEEINIFSQLNNNGDLSSTLSYLEKSLPENAIRVNNYTDTFEKQFSFNINTGFAYGTASSYGGPSIIGVPLNVNIGWGETYRKTISFDKPEFSITKSALTGKSGNNWKYKLEAAANGSLLNDDYTKLISDDTSDDPNSVIDATKRNIPAFAKGISLDTLQWWNIPPDFQPNFEVGYRAQLSVLMKHYTHMRWGGGENIKKIDARIKPSRSRTFSPDLNHPAVSGNQRYRLKYTNINKCINFEENTANTNALRNNKVVNAIMTPCSPSTRTTYFMQNSDYTLSPHDDTSKKISIPGENGQHYETFYHEGGTLKTVNGHHKVDVKTVDGISYPYVATNSTVRDSMWAIYGF